MDANLILIIYTDSSYLLTSCMDIKLDYCIYKRACNCQNWLIICFQITSKPNCGLFFRSEMRLSKLEIINNNWSKKWSNYYYICISLICYLHVWRWSSPISPLSPSSYCTNISSSVFGGWVSPGWSHSDPSSPDKPHTDTWSGTSSANILSGPASPTPTSGRCTCPPAPLRPPRPARRRGPASRPTWPGRGWGRSCGCRWRPPRGRPRHRRWPPGPPSRCRTAGACWRWWWGSGSISTRQWCLCLLHHQCHHHLGSIQLPPASSWRRYSQCKLRVPDNDSWEFLLKSITILQNLTLGESVNSCLAKLNRVLYSLGRLCSDSDPKLE